MSNTSPDVFPAISMDINLGKHTSYLDVNMRHITNKLSDGGLTPDEITGLSIHFSAADNLLSRSKDITTQGTYNPKEHHITIARPTELDPPLEASPVVRMVVATKEYSDTLEHELEHVIAKKDVELQKQEKSYRKKLLGKRLLRSSPLLYVSSAAAGMALEHGAHIEQAYGTSLALAIGVIALKHTVLRKRIAKLEFKEYLNAPEEQQARRAGELAPDGLVLSIPQDVSVTFSDSTMIINADKLTADIDQ